MKGKISRRSWVTLARLIGLLVVKVGSPLASEQKLPFGQGEMLKIAARTTLVIILACFGSPVNGYPQQKDLTILIHDLEKGDSSARRQAAKALGEMKESRAVEHLIAALRDSDWYVRNEAAEALGRIGKPAVEPTIAALKSRRQNYREKGLTFYARQGPEMALGKMGSSAVEPLLRLLADDDTSVRRDAAQALGEIDDPRAAAALVAALREGNLDVVMGAYPFFIRRGEPGTEQILIKAFENALSGYPAEEMAQSFLNSGNDLLSAKARSWAQKAGYIIMPYGNKSGPKWGSSR